MFRVGLGFDIHPFGGDGPLVLGGVTVDGPGLAGHSDADVVAHAVADSVLGPTGLPDLGTLFPAGAERWRGASSLELLRDVVGRIAADGWWIGNVDVVVAAERPKLAPHIPEMAATLTAVLRAAQEPLGPGVLVSVKPKHGEGIGTIGRGEGIACWAVSLLERA
jgi:2-C-methyl-D-erythritol 2,4-cyclodiphosphate synthase